MLAVQAIAVYTHGIGIIPYKLLYVFAQYDNHIRILCAELSLLCMNNMIIISGYAGNGNVQSSVYRNNYGSSEWTLQRFDFERQFGSFAFRYALRSRGLAAKGPSPSPSRRFHRVWSTWR